MAPKPKVIYAGNRDIAVEILEFTISEGLSPLALLLPTEEIGSHNQDLIDLCMNLKSDRILFGNEFRQPEGLHLLTDLEPDYIICIHFPYMVPEQVLSIPQEGVLNLHPGYLPYNRGWHTPSWAILTDTPIGGTLHFMDESVDTGDIVHQKMVEIMPYDTADSLYKRIKEIEVEVFKEAFPTLLDRSYSRTSQKNMKGSIHKKEDLLSADFRKLDLEQEVITESLLRDLRALTTNRVEESAYFENDGNRYYLQVKITKDENHGK